MGLLPLLFALSLTAPSALGPEAAPCVPQVQLAQPARCPAVGPGAYLADVAAVQLPAVIPALPLAPLERYDPVVSFKYARVVTADAPVFASPADGVAGVVARTVRKGFVFVNLVEAVEQDGQAFVKIRTGEYLRAGDVSPVQVTDFQGLLFSGPPAYPVGWVVSAVRPSLRPGMAPPEQGLRVPRKTVIQIFGTVHVGDWDWYLIGPNQWVDQRAVSRLSLNPPPEGVTGRWIQVDLYEQTLAAYEDGRLLYATLVSSGLNEWPTPPGLFHIYARLYADRMRGTYRPDGSDFYSLEMVPWVMYYDGARALHGEYWHDALGFKRSHGCVNLAPLDARWLFDWAANGTPVWVYDPSGQTPTDVAGGGAP